MTYREVLKYIQDEIPQEIYNNNPNELSQETNLILEHLTGKDTQTILTNLDESLTLEQEAVLKQIVSQRKLSKPLAYILGKGRFIGTDFIVSENTLIPRTDTEFIYYEALDAIDSLKGNVDVLDLCCGTGVIGLSVKKEKPDISLTLSDISKDALEVASLNSRNLNLEADLIKSDLFNSIEGKYNIIISNPPYIPPEEYETLDRNIKDFEPKLALIASENGYYYLRNIIEQAGEYLKDNGILLLECGYNQGPTLERLLEENGFSDIKIINDFAGYNRVARAKK